MKPTISLGVSAFSCDLPPLTGPVWMLVDGQHSVHLDDCFEYWQTPAQYTIGSFLKNFFNPGNVTLSDNVNQVGVQSVRVLTVRTSAGLRRLFGLDKLLARALEVRRKTRVARDVPYGLPGRSTAVNWE